MSLELRARRIWPILKGFLVSVGTCSLAFVPVMFFTFLGLSSGSNIHETNPLFATYFSSHGLIVGLFLALVTNTLSAALILGLLHLIFYRPVIFYDPSHTGFARKLIAVGIGIFLLVWGRRFFADSYNDMNVLSANHLGPGSLLWSVFLGCLIMFVAGVSYWGRLVWLETRTSDDWRRHETKVHASVIGDSSIP